MNGVCIPNEQKNENSRTEAKINFSGVKFNKILQIRGKIWWSTTFSMIKFIIAFNILEKFNIVYFKNQ